jgi:protein-S-isoprenylcysteine O-methyltransferase Ste14
MKRDECCVRTTVSELKKRAEVSVEEGSRHKSVARLPRLADNVPMPKEPLVSKIFARNAKQVTFGITTAVGALLAVVGALLASKTIVRSGTEDLAPSWVVQSLTVFVSLITIYVVWVSGRVKAEKTKEQEQRIEKAESRAEAEPEKAKFAWDLARVKLEAYFDRNLSQVNQIFYVALAVMFVGFGFILWAVWLSIGHPTITPTSIVAASAGIVSQFIGATFMLIYRSTMSQANSFMSVLERINTVGMSIQILDSIPEGESKNLTRSQMIDVLLNTNMKFRPAAPKIAKKKALTSPSIEPE